MKGTNDRTTNNKRKREENNKQSKKVINENAHTHTKTNKQTKSHHMGNTFTAPFGHPCQKNAAPSLVRCPCRFRFRGGRRFGCFFAVFGLGLSVGEGAHSRAQDRPLGVFARGLGMLASAPLQFPTREPLSSEG